MNRVRIINQNLVVKHGQEAVLVDAYLRKDKYAKQQAETQRLVEALMINPNLTEDMVHPASRKYLGVAKREYVKTKSFSKAAE